MSSKEGKGSGHSKPSSFMTDEDWDQALTKAELQQEQQQREQQGEGSGSVLGDAQETAMNGSSNQDTGMSTTPMRSPVMKEEEEGKGDKENRNPIEKHNTPSSPSEIRKLTKKNSADGTLSIREARQFAKELNEWINKDHSPFEDDEADKSFS